MSSAPDLLDILQKYKWQIVSNNYVEVIPADREDAWNDIIITALRSTPFDFRSHLRRSNLEHFDYNAPIYYNLKTKTLSVLNDNVLKSLTPPRYPTINTELIKPIHVITIFILLILAYIGWRYGGERLYK
ncbi:pif-6 [Hyphantria cunea granulovirus]|uniref:Pif-6 n=1 Tax=Hyphantria cunea granulovirus TaxID=307448 RepID=A0AAE6D0J0_9BBAC|nr:pif-6 [Hyphantria cunea granulovirus]QBQ01653.1 pif-6 [Hyphantria cunea granulovirus]